jgi:AcrR family transcriptional regulator
MTVLAAAGFQKRFRYHHGNLREALIGAATEILSAAGADALNLRALAKMAGVSQAAPYSHFKDKDELLAAVAESGFQRLALRMAEDATASNSTQERIERLMTSYITFARDNKPLFGIMFGREVADMKKFPTLAMTAGKSYALISAALSKRADASVDTRFLTVTIWSLCHGLATLVIDGKIDYRQFGCDTLSDFVRQNVAVFKDQLV